MKKQSTSPVKICFSLACTVLIFSGLLMHGLAEKEPPMHTEDISPAVLQTDVSPTPLPTPSFSSDRKISEDSLPPSNFVASPTWIGIVEPAILPPDLTSAKALTDPLMSQNTTQVPPKTNDTNTKKAAFLLALASIAGATTAAYFYGQSNASKKGIWVSPDMRHSIVEQINAISSTRVYVDAEGFLKINTLASNPDKSPTAGKLLQELIESDSITYIGQNAHYQRLNSDNTKILTQDVVGGITIGDKSTGHSILLENHNPSAQLLMHELAHAFLDHNKEMNGLDSAGAIENQILQELGMHPRNLDKAVENERQFYNAYNATEAYLLDLAATSGAKVTEDTAFNTFVVSKGDVSTKFVLDKDGTYLEPESKKIVVRQAQYRYQMHMDISSNEVYLRHYIEKLGGSITWNAEEKTAKISLDAKTFHIKLGEYGSKIVNDRLVMDKITLEQYLGVSQSVKAPAQGSANLTNTSNAVNNPSAKSTSNPTSTDGYSYNESYYNKT